MDEKITSSVKIMGSNSNDIAKCLIQLDRVEEFTSEGDYRRFKRVLVFNEEDTIDTFYFHIDGNKMIFNTVTTTDQTISLLEVYMMCIQRECTLEDFINELWLYFEKKGYNICVSK